MAVSNNATFSLPITAVDGTTIQIKADDRVKFGMSGYVVHRFDERHQIITAQCQHQKASQLSTLECKPYEGLTHEMIAQVKMPLDAKDEITFNMMPNALIIAPDQGRYLALESILKSQGRLMVHADLLAMRLWDDDEVRPQKETFQGFCHTYMIGDLYFVMDDGTYQVDCQTFKTLDKRAILEGEGESMSPFYHRLVPVERSFFDFGPSDIGTFTPYYKALISE